MCPTCREREKAAFSVKGVPPGGGAGGIGAVPTIPRPFSFDHHWQATAAAADDLLLQTVDGDHTPYEGEGDTRCC